MTTIYANVSVLSEIMVRSRQRIPHETGGPIFGTWLREREVLLTHAFETICYQDQYHVTLDGLESLRISQSVRRENHGLIGYLGDWHSHVAGPPVPSFVDWLTARRVVARYATRPIVLIANTDDDLPTAYVLGSVCFETCALAILNDGSPRAV